MKKNIEKKDKNKKTCNMCNKPMIYWYNYTYFCHNSACPNFSLLQVAAEDLPTKNTLKICD